MNNLHLQARKCSGFTTNSTGSKKIIQKSLLYFQKGLCFRVMSYVKYFLMFCWELILDFHVWEWYIPLWRKAGLRKGRVLSVMPGVGIKVLNTCFWLIVCRHFLPNTVISCEMRGPRSCRNRHFIQIPCVIFVNCWHILAANSWPDRE